MRNHLLDTNKAGDKLDPRYLNTPGRYCDGAGLYVDVAAPGQGSYLFRYKAAYRSLGSANVYSIEEAREKAAKMWQAARHGNDPFALLDHERARPVGKTFATAMAEYLKAKSPHWAASNRARELRRYEFLFGQIPDFVALPVKAIDQDAKNKALAVWDGQNKKRSDVGYYIGAILAYAETGKLRLAAGSVPVDHHEAMPYAQVPSFYAGLPDTVDANALRFLILTGARASEVIGGDAKAPASWGEIEGDTWVIPGSRMKGKREHRVPLSAQMVALLGERRADNVPLFKVTITAMHCSTPCARPRLNTRFMDLEHRFQIG
jgi:hypothetical protein